MERFLSSRRVLFVTLLPLLAVAAFLLLLYSTPQGLGLNDDSIAYIAGARSLLSGQGYREAWLISSGIVTHFPPGFPAALALLGWILNIDPLRAARLLNALLFGLNTLLAGWLAFRMTSARAAGVLAAVLFLVTPAMLRIHSNAMSEPLYIFFTLAAFLALDVYLQRSAAPRAWVWPVLAGSLMGLACLTRYAALSLLAAALTGLFILSASWRERFRGAGLLLAGFLPWLLGWSARNWLVGGSLTNRALGWHPITAENARMGVRTFSGFMVPVDAWHSYLLKIHGLFDGLILILALGLLIWTVRLGLARFLDSRKPVEPLAFLNALYIFAYFLLLAATMIFFDPATKFQLRIVAPLFVPLILLLAYGLYRLAIGSGAVRPVILLAAILLAVSAFGQGENLADLRRGGQIYANERWFDAPALAVLRTLPPEVVIHSNQPGVIYLYAGRPGALLPDTPRDAESLRAEVLAGQAVIVIFKTVGVDESLRVYYDSLGEGLASQKYNGDVIYSAP